MPTAAIAAGPAPDGPRALYPRLLGASWFQLAEPVRFAHATAPTVRAGGRLRIARGRGHVARLLAALLRLPRASDAAEVRLVVTSRGEVDWRRRFDDRCLNTRQYATGHRELGEQIGIAEFRFRLDASDGSLVFRQVEAAVVLGALRLRMPAAWAPKVEAREDPAGARRLHIHVGVVLPVLGRVLTYEGVIELEEHRE